METQQTSIKDRIIQVMSQKGPVLPVHIAKAIESNTIMASAHLSELVSKQQVKISNIKVGGSPLYYLPDHASRLQEFSDNLHEKEKKVYDQLKENKIMRDKDLDPVFRVAIRQIKDFAVPLEVSYKQEKEIFWKWYLVSNKDAEPMIRGIVSPEERQERPKEEPAQEKKPEVVEKKPEQAKQETPKKSSTAGLFSKKVDDYLSKNRIDVFEKDIIRKGSEIDLVIRIPSQVGSLKYYCKAKSKKRVSDSDLSAAFAKGQLKKLPVLFLTDGELTKKGKESLERDFNLHYKKI